MFSFSPCGDGVELGKGEVPRLINGISQPGKWSAHNKLSAAYLWVFWLPFILIGSQGYTEKTAHPRMAMQALKCALPQWWVERAYLPEWLTVAGPWGRVFRGFLRGIPAEWSFCTHACMHAKSFQLCLTLCDPMDCSPPGSSVHGIFQARVGCCALLQGIIPTQGSNPCLRHLLHWQVGSLH